MSECHDDFELLQYQNLDNEMMVVRASRDKKFGWVETR